MGVGVGRRVNLMIYTYHCGGLEYMGRRVN